VEFKKVYNIMDLIKNCLFLEDGLMEKNIKANGEITRCMGRDILVGKMAGDMLGNILKISKRFFHG